MTTEKSELGIDREGSTARTEAPASQPVRELLCQRCDRDYTVWFTDNPLWNKYAGDDFSFLCMDCFALLAEGAGLFPTAWYLTTESAPDVVVRPSKKKALVSHPKPLEQRIAYAEKTLPEWRANLAEWKRTGVYRGRRVDDAWLRREERAIADLESDLASWQRAKARMRNDL